MRSIVALAIFLVVAITTTTTLVAAQTTFLDVGGITAQYQDTTYGDLYISNPTNANIIFGPKLRASSVTVFFTTNVNFTFIDFTCTGTVLFASLGTNSILTVKNSHFTGAVQIGGASAATSITFDTNVFYNTASGLGTLLDFQSSVQASSVAINSNVMTLTTTVGGEASCMLFAGSSTLKGDTLEMKNNTCRLTSSNQAKGIRIRSQIDFAQSVKIDSNLLVVSSSASSASCVIIDDLVNAILSGTFFTSNLCTVSGVDNSIGVEISSTALDASVKNVTSPIMKISGNTITASSSGGTASSTAFLLGYVLRQGVNTAIGGNTISVSANRATTAITLSQGVDAYSFLDLSSNSITVANYAAGTTDSGILRIAQNTLGSSKKNVTITLYKNTLALTGTYYPGYIAIPSSYPVTGSWLFVQNTLTTPATSPSVSALFYPALNVASDTTSSFFMQCNTYNAAVLTTSQVQTNSLLNEPTASMPSQLACGVCSWAFHCNVDTTYQVVSVSGECYCRCNTDRTRYDPLPRGTQCSGDAGRAHTSTKTKTISVSKTETRTISQIPLPTRTKTATYDDTSNRLTDNPNATITDPILDTGSIVGIVIGSLVFLILLALIIWYCCCKDTKGGACCSCCEDEDEEGKNRTRGGEGGIEVTDEDEDDDLDENGEPRPMRALHLPEIKTVTEILADRDEASLRHFNELADLDDINGEGELAPNPPANLYRILSLPTEVTESPSTTPGSTPRNRRISDNNQRHQHHQHQHHKNASVKYPVPTATTTSAAATSPSRNQQHNASSSATASRKIHITSDDDTEDISEEMRNVHSAAMSPSEG